MSINWTDVAKTVGGFAPWIGTALGGPAGGAIGVLVSTALGVDNTPEAVAEAVRRDPEAAAKLQALQAQTEIELKRMILQAEDDQRRDKREQFQAEVEDRKSARAMAIDPKDRIRPFITFTLLFAVVFVVVAIFSGIAKEVLTDPTAASTIGIVLGALLIELKTALAFWFGTLRDPDNQTAKLVEALTKNFKKDQNNDRSH